jgi:hypothetical protein
MRWIIVVFLVVAYLGIQLFQRDWATNPTVNPTVMLDIGLASVGVLGASGMYLWSRRSVSPEERHALAESRKLWAEESFYHFDVGYFTVIAGAMFELLYLTVSPALICIPLGYVFASYICFRMTREKVVSTPWITMFAFWVAASSVAFSCVAIRDPEMLAKFFSSSGVTVTVSRSISYLFIPWIQFCLVSSSGLLASHTWRSRLLLRNGLGSKELQDRFELALQRNSSAPWTHEFSEIFSDIPSLLSSFEQGNFPTVVGLGWGMVDRGLALLYPKKRIRQRVLEIGITKDEFESCYDARTKMAHKGQHPAAKDALSLLLLVKHILEQLCERNSKSKN